eukprot:symbB.v1.2.009545.t4/scaffold604.1/size182248/3
MALDSEVFQCPKTMKAAGVRGQSVRVLARLRPFLDNEEEPTDLPCLRTVGSSQLEVLLEPRALLTDTAYRSRGRRRTIAMEKWESDKLPYCTRKPWEVFQSGVQQRVTSYFLAHEAPEEPDATFFKQFEKIGARAVFAGLSKEDQDSYRHISEMELAGYSTYCLCREQRRSGGIADDDSSDDEEESFRRLSNEEKLGFVPDNPHDVRRSLRDGGFGWLIDPDVAAAEGSEQEEEDAEAEAEEDATGVAATEGSEQEEEAETEEDATGDCEDYHIEDDEDEPTPPPEPPKSARLDWSCCVCHGRRGDRILCDGCETGRSWIKDRCFHFSCHTPLPPSDVADSDWFCRLCTEKIARTRKLPLRPGDVCWAIQKGRMYPALVLQLNVAEKDGDTAMRSGTWSESLYKLKFFGGGHDAWLSARKVKVWQDVQPTMVSPSLRAAIAQAELVLERSHNMRTWNWMLSGSSDSQKEGNQEATTRHWSQACKEDKDARNATGASEHQATRGLHDIGSCKSAGSMPSVCSRGSIESPFLAGRGLESRTFSFDQVFDANASDDQVFSEIQDELQAALEGEAGSARCCVHSCIWCHWQWKDSYGHQHRREGGAKTQQRGRTIGKGGLSLGGLGSDCGNLQRALSGPADSSRCVSQCS